MKPTEIHRAIESTKESIAYMEKKLIKLQDDLSKSEIAYPNDLVFGLASYLDGDDVIFSFYAIKNGQSFHIKYHTSRHPLDIDSINPIDLIKKGSQSIWASLSLQDKLKVQNWLDGLEEEENPCS